MPRSSPAGKEFANRNCDFLFTLLRDHAQGAQAVADTRAGAARYGRQVGVFAPGYVVCRATRREAEDYHRYYAEENGDWEAVEGMMGTQARSGSSRPLARALPRDAHSLRRRPRRLSPHRLAR